MEEPIYRANAGLMIINENGEIFIGQRNDTKEEAWQMPQGGIDEGEDILAAARRELLEETSIPHDQVELLAIHPEWLIYEFADAKTKKKMKAEGQKQKWFLFKFTGDDKSIDVTGCATPEFTQWRWTDADEVLDIVWPRKKEVYETVLKTFGKHLKDGGLTEKEAEVGLEDIAAILDDSEPEDPAKEAIKETQST